MDIRYKIVAAISNMKGGYKPADVAQTAGRVLHWIKAQKGKEDEAFVIFEGVLKSQPATIAGLGWKATADKLMKMSEELKPIESGNSAPSKSGLDLQKEELAKMQKANPRDKSLLIDGQKPPKPDKKAKAKKPEPEDDGFDGDPIVID